MWLKVDNNMKVLFFLFVYVTLEASSFFVRYCFLVGLESDLRFQGLIK